MFARSVSRRWFLNTIGAVFVILVIFVASLSVVVQSSTYSSIELALSSRMDELLNWFSGNGGRDNVRSFTAITQDYVENSLDRKSVV